MRFEGRELSGVAEPVELSELKVGNVYYSLQFLDQALLVPILLPIVFLGKDVEDGNEGRLYFQSYESYLAGVKLDHTRHDSDVFQIPTANNIKHIFEYENALELLMYTSLQRRHARANNS